MNVIHDAYKDGLKLQGWIKNNIMIIAPLLSIYHSSI